MGFRNAVASAGLDNMQTICTLLQTDKHTNASSLDFYRPDALPDAQPTVSLKAQALVLEEQQEEGWRRGVVVSGVRRMNEVNARRARLVPGWVTVFGRVYHLGM